MENIIKVKCDYQRLHAVEGAIAPRTQTVCYHLELLNYIQVWNTEITIEYVERRYMCFFFFDNTSISFQTYHF